MSPVIEIPRPVNLVSFSFHPWGTSINCILVWLDDLRDFLIFPFFSF